MTALIAYPFRVAGTGEVMTAQDGTADYHAMELAVALLTRPGERELVPSFGTADPAFDGFDADALSLHVSIFGPPVSIEQVESEFIDETTQDVVVSFD